MNKHVSAPAILRGAMNVRADGGASAEVLTAIGDFKQNFEDFKAKQTEADKAVLAIAEASGSEAKAAIDAAAKAVEDVEKIAANLIEIEQKIGDQLISGKHVPAASVGQIIVNSPEYKALDIALGQTPGADLKLRVEANTITGQGGSPVENVDTLVATDRRPGITPGAFRALRAKDMIPVIPTSSNAWQFTRELLFTNAAAEVAEGGAKAESTLTFEDVTVNIRTIAHFIKASNQILADAPALRAYIDTRLRYGVELREDLQIVAGDGTGQNISGMTDTGNFTAFTPTTGDTAIDSVSRAKEAVMTADYIPTGVLMNPADWAAIERLKSTTNEYLVGDPFGTIIPRLWGLPVVLSNNLTATNFLVADFATSYEYAERQSTVIDIGFVNADFTNNLVTIRAEKRGALATIRPASAYYGSLTT